MQFVDKEDDFAFAFFDFRQNRFKAFFEFTAEFSAGDEGAHVEGEDGFVFESLGDVSVNDSLSESFGNGGFAHAGFAYEDGVIFGFS